MADADSGPAAGNPERVDLEPARFVVGFDVFSVGHHGLGYRRLGVNMKRILFGLVMALLAVEQAQAVCAIPNTFSAGNSASASQVNANFTAAKNCIETLQATDSTLSSTFAGYVANTGSPSIGATFLFDQGTGGIAISSGAGISPFGTGFVKATAMSATGQIDDNDLAASAVDGGTGGEIEDETITGADVLNDAIQLITDTAGNFVATITGDTEITVSGAGTEGRAVTLAIASTITRDTELALKSAASSTLNAVAKFCDTTGDLCDSLLTVADTTGNVSTPGSISAGGSSGASTVVFRNMADGGWVECGVVSTTWTCATDADGTPDGTL